MKYFIALITNPLGETEKHIVQPLPDGGYRCFPMTDENPNMVEYLAWVAEGNTAEEWTGN
jgi:hypothetical protein